MSSASVKLNRGMNSMNKIYIYCSCICLFVIACLLHPCDGVLGDNFMKIRNMVEKYQKEELLSKLSSENGFSHLKEQFITQPMDHFDPRVTATYQQRYWANDAYWKSTEGPVFLYIGGEGALYDGAILSGHIVEMAKQHHALLFAVEHRFYGKSINEDGLELENLQYLSSQQALADLARFHHFSSEKFHLSSKNVWLCFGGSYPGALSAWFRLKYPHLVYGAVASSAPVQAQTNFEGYNEVVAASLGDPVVNGSYHCTKMVKQAFEKIDGLFSTGDHKVLEQDFHSCNELTYMNDINQFVSNLAGIFMGTVQYNNEMPGQNVDKLCTEMTKTDNAYLNLVQLNKRYIPGNCTDNSWANFMKQVLDTSPKFEGVGLRQWLYQTCTQFGYYQTCDSNTTCIFSNYMKLQPNLDLCRIAFKIPDSLVYKLIQFSNDYYGSNKPKGSRIIFVNGSIDPWHALSVLRDSSSSEISIFINGTAHCANMAKSQPSDPKALKAARIEISARIRHWLQNVE